MSNTTKIKYVIINNKLYQVKSISFYHMMMTLVPCDQSIDCFLQALFPQKCRLTSSKLHGEFPQYCISSAGTLSGAGEEPLQAYKVY